MELKKIIKEGISNFEWVDDILPFDESVEYLVFNLATPD